MDHARTRPDLHAGDRG